MKDSPSMQEAITGFVFLKISRASHLDGFRRTYQRTAHKRILFKSSWSWSHSLGHLISLYKATSSANILTEECWTTSWISLIYNKKSNGPKTEPCGTSELTGNHEDCEPHMVTLWKRHVRKERIYLRSVPNMPKASSLSSNLSWGTESNALANSRKRQWTELRSSKNLHQSWAALRSRDTVHRLFRKPNWLSLRRPDFSNTDVNLLPSQQ